MASKIHATISPFGELVGASLTGSYQTVTSTTDDVLVVTVFNSCNKPIILSLDNGVTDHFKLDKESFVLDLRSNDRQVKSITCRAKHAGVAPTSGSIRITLMK